MGKKFLLTRRWIVFLRIVLVQAMRWRFIFFALMSVSMNFLAMFSAILMIEYPKVGGIATVCLFPIMLLSTLKAFRVEQEEKKKEINIK